MSATGCIHVRLPMKSTGWLSRLLNQQPSFVVCLGLAVAVFFAMAGIASAQNPVEPAPAPDSTMSLPQGYSVHQSVDVGGRLNDTAGSGAMYDSLLNQHTGPRVLGETFQLH